MHYMSTQHARALSISSLVSKITATLNVFYKRNKKLACCAVRSYKSLYSAYTRRASTNTSRVLPIPECYITAHSTRVCFLFFPYNFKSSLKKIIRRYIRVALQICRNINQIKVCMETGRTVVLLNLEKLYESLYDVLNQVYESVKTINQTIISL